MMIRITNYCKEFEQTILGLEGLTSSSSTGGSAENAGKEENTARESNIESSNAIGLIRQQTALFNALRRQCEAVIGDFTDYPVHVYDIKSKGVSETWKQLQGINLNMWETCNNPSLLGINDEEYVQIEKIVQDAIINLSIKTNHNNFLTIFNVASTHSVQLPKITIPKFNHDFLKWYQFHDLFTEIIDKQPIPSSQKMMYLTTSLSGEAATLVNHLPVTNDNYSIA